MRVWGSGYVYNVEIIVLLGVFQRVDTIQAEFV